MKRSNVMFGLLLVLLALTFQFGSSTDLTDNYVTNYYLRNPWLKYDAEKMRLTIFFLMKKFREMHQLTNQLEAKMETDLMRYNLKKNILKTFLKIKVEKTAKKKNYFHFM